MSKKNSNVNLEDLFNNKRELLKIFQNFKKKLSKIKDRNLLVAVSGGPDSLALTALTKLYKIEKKKNFYYVLINHNIRKNSSKEAISVKKLLKKHKLSLNVFSNKEKIKNNIQSQARQIRYEVLKKYCIKNNIKIILTGHNLEDQVETFFIRLSRGSGLTGLSAMKPLSKLNRRIKLFRPLLDVRKKHLIEISKLVFGKFVKDPSNYDNKYLRTKIRKLETPLKKSGINYDQIIKSINYLSSSKEILDSYFKKTFDTTVKKLKNEILIDLKKFYSCREEFKIRLINQSIKELRKNYYNPRSKKVINLINNIKSKNFSKSTLGGCLFIKKKYYLSLKVEKVR